jgi:hypothetical protein
LEGNVPANNESIVNFNSAVRLTRNLVHKLSAQAALASSNHAQLIPHDEEQKSNANELSS